MTLCFASSMRYTPGRCVRLFRKVFTSNGACSFTGLFIQQLPGLRKYRVEHGLCQATRIRVVAAAMIGIEHLEIAELMQRRMTELVVRLTQPHRLDDSAVRDSTQGHDNSVLGQQPQLVRQELVAGIYLGTDRLVVRRQAFDGI